MTLHNTIKEEVKKAMLTKKEVKLLTLRGLLSAFTNELVIFKRKPSEELADEEALTVIRRAVKQRKDSIEQFTKGLREDLADNERSELRILETYLPAQMSKEEVMKVAQAKMIELNITDKSKANMLMSKLMKELKGKADGNVVKEVVDSLLTS